VTDQVTQLKKWILARNPDSVDIADDYDLIEHRLVDSLSFVELLIIIQQLSGETIDQMTINIDDFRSLRAIANRYFSVTTAG
jgi:hypothetical protein